MHHQTRSLRTWIVYALLILRSNIKIGSRYFSKYYTSILFNNEDIWFIHIQGGVKIIGSAVRKIESTVVRPGLFALRMFGDILCSITDISVVLLGSSANIGWAMMMGFRCVSDANSRLLTGVIVLQCYRPLGHLLRRPAHRLPSRAPSARARQRWINDIAVGPWLSVEVRKS